MATHDIISEIQNPENFNTALLVSLLEESHSEEYYDVEELNKLMQSLQAEINVNEMAESSHGLAIKPSQTGAAGEMEEDGVLTADFEWSGWTDDTDGMGQVPSLPSDGMNWYLEDQVGEMDCMTEFREDCSDQNYHCGVTLMELEYSSSMWLQETYDTVLYN